MLVEEGERAALYFQRKDFEIVRKIKFAPTPNKPRRLDTLSNVLGDVRVGSDSDLSASRRHFCFTPRNRTLIGAAGMSEKCQNQKSSAAWVMFR